MLNYYYNNWINGHLLVTYYTLNLETNMGVNLGKEIQIPNGDIRKQRFNGDPYLSIKS